MDEKDLREDRDLWKQSEETCSRQYDKLLAEHSALRKHAERLAEALEHWVFLYRWRVDGMNVEQARIHAKALVREWLTIYRADYPKDDA